MYKINDSLSEIENKKRRSDFVFLVVVAFVLLFMSVIVFLNTQVFFSVYVSGSSMSPTLKSGNVLFVNKVIDATDGDIIIIDGVKPNQSGTGYDWLIKRAIVVGKKGRVISAKIGVDGYIYVDGKKLNENYLPSGTKTPCDQTYIEWEIREGEILYLGDNRSNSTDSRHYGVCKKENVVGVVQNWALSMRKVSRFFYDVGEFFRTSFKGAS